MFAFRTLKNQRGFSMVEMLIAIAIGALLLGVAVRSFTKQQTLFKNQADGSVIRETARFSIQELTRDLRMAGYGVPSAVGITSATVNSITFLSNTDEISTTVPGDLAASATAITVNSATGFTTGKTIVILSATKSPVLYDLKTISSVAGNVINLTSGLSRAYLASDITVVNGYNTVSMTYNSVSHIVTKSVAGVIKDRENVTTLAYAYLDKTGATLSAPVSAANLPNIRRINISMTLQDPNNTSATTAIDNTHVNLRNMNQ